MAHRYDRAETTGLLLDAGIQEFAAMGIHGARVDRIAGSAGANKALIYSYFGNKEEFFATAVRQVMSELAEAVPITADDLPGYAGRLFDHLCAHPEVVRLFEHEGMHYAEHLDRVPEVEARIAYHGDRAAVVGEALHRSSDAESMFMAVIGMTYWFVAAPQVVRMIFGPDRAAAALRYRAYVVSATRTLIEHPPVV